MNLYVNAAWERIIIGILCKMNSQDNPEMYSSGSPTGSAVASTPLSAINARIQLWRAVRWPLIFLLVLWAIQIFAIDDVFLGISRGILPRHWSGLPGILTAPFLHADFDHLTSNSLPILIIGAALFHFYRDIAWQVISLIWLLTGFWVWLMARPVLHIGASGLIYGGVVFLFFSGIFRKDIRLMAISFLVVFLYGSLAWGILPLVPDQSWESHLSGSIAGVFSAVYFRKQGPQRKKYQWELDEEQERLAEMTSIVEEENLPAEEDNPIVIRYDYKPSENDSQKGN